MTNEARGKSAIIYTCQREDCGHTWTSRPSRLESGRSRPVRCPRCQSTKWDEQREETERT